MELIPAWLWFIAGLILLVIELNTATFFFGTVGFGALLASLADFFTAGELASFVTFVLGTAFAAYMAWKFDIYSSSQVTLRTGPDRLIGEIGTVEDKIDPLTGEGVIVVDGEKWRAETSSDDPIENGEKVVVRGVEGTALVVEKADRDSINENPTEEGEL